MLPTFNVITCRRCGRSFMAPSPRYRFCPGCQKEKHRLTGAPPPGPRPQGLDKPVRVFAHWDDDDGGGCGQAWTKTPPHLGADARWWIWIDGPRLVRCEDVRVLTREELRQLTSK